MAQRLAPSRAKGRIGEDPSKERTVNTIFDDVATAFASITTWDDIAAGLACVTFCAASASLFVMMFVGAY